MTRLIPVLSVLTLITLTACPPQTEPPEDNTTIIREVQEIPKEVANDRDTDSEKKDDGIGFSISADDDGASVKIDGDDGSASIDVDKR